MRSTSVSSADFARLLADRLDPPPWEPEGRFPLQPHQLPPEGHWSLWLLEGGRGCGKTEACARYMAAYMRANPGHRGRIIAPTMGDAVEACVQGTSGLLAVDPEITFRPSAPGGAKVTWPNGSEALVFGTPSPRDVDRLRAAGNRHIDWWEEMAANAHLKDAWAQAQFGLRLGEHPHSIGSTTPRSVDAYRTIRDLDGTVRVHATLFDNPGLPAEFVEQMRAQYEGTRLGRQELYGELIDDAEGALWTRERLDASRVDKDNVPDLTRCVVAIDPAASSGSTSDDTGIIVAGLGIDGHGYILADHTCHLEPNGWGNRAVNAYRKFAADKIVAEVNNGGEMVEHVIRTVDPDVPYKAVHASRGKQTRAQPVASLWEGRAGREPRVHLVGPFPKLEDQLCQWEPGDESPDRLDALVWAVTELMLGTDNKVGSGRKIWR